jgi:hypothetical protein
LRAVAEAALPDDAETVDEFDWVIPVGIYDADEIEVVHAEITMRVSRKPR